MNTNHSKSNGQFITAESAAAIRRRARRNASIARCRRQDLGTIGVNVCGLYAGTLEEYEIKERRRTAGPLRKIANVLGDIALGILFFLPLVVIALMLL